MAILYGTTGDGTTLPVLVDQFGNLLAKGIEGPIGPPGPPGVGQLPPDPYEGAILGWEDGDLAWIGGSVPLPAGTYGPYTYIDGDERLDIPQDASSLVNGQQLYMSDLYGDEISVKYRTDTIANVNGNVLTFSTSKDFGKFEVGEEVQPGVNITAIDDKVPSITVDGGSWYGADGTGDAGDGRFEPSQEWSSLTTAGSVKFNPDFGPTKAFDGKTDIIGTERFLISTSPPYNVNEITTIRLPGLVAGQTVEFLGKQAFGGPAVVKFNGNTVSGILQSGALAAEWNTLGTSVVGENIITVDVADPQTDVYAIRVGGVLLVDSSVQGGPGDTNISKVLSGSGSVFLGTNGVIVLRANNKEWVDGFYVTAPAQQIAARKVASAAIRRKKK